jgi:hypothetical protein
MHEMKGFLACVINVGIAKKANHIIILVHSVPKPPHVWETVYQALLSHSLRFFHLVNNKEFLGLKEPDYNPSASY